VAVLMAVLIYIVQPQHALWLYALGQVRCTVPSGSRPVKEAATSTVALPSQARGPRSCLPSQNACARKSASMVKL